MMPEHCRHVSVRRVDYELTPDRIKAELLDSKIYKGTDYLILNNNINWSIARVGKTPGRGLFWLVTGVEVISSQDDTVFVEDSSVDVLNRNAMVAVAQNHPEKTVIVQGKFEHVSFIQFEEPLELVILEVVPPKPPKVITLVSDLLKFISLPRAIKIVEKVVDISSMLSDGETDTFVLPCKASGLSTNKKVLYLDENPKLDSDPEKNITLIGCDLSLRIFKEIYGFEPNFINICPAKLAEEYAKTQPVLIKCCAPKKFERRGNLLMVPWGATYSDLEDALRAFLKMSDDE